MEEVFSKGELHVQKLAGEYEVAKTRTPMALNDQLNKFFAFFLENQTMFNITSTDENEAVWISMISGPVNFIEVIDYGTIRIQKKLIITPLEDIVYKNIKHNKEVGLLFIDWESSRRYRLNGKIVEENDYLIITIEETYGICPKYIQKRSVTHTTTPIPQQTITSIKGSKIKQVHKSLIENSNTFFLGTRGASKKTDASHKGGKNGFVKFINDDTLRIPDYPGNSMFNSMGNLHENPNAGLIFIDYENNKMLQLTGSAEIQFNQTTKEDMLKSGYTGRFWLFKINNWIWTENHNLINWKFIAFSPFNP